MNLYLRLLAFFRLSPTAVCRASQGGRDYHDYPDSVEGQPVHFVALTCKRCGKEFEI